MSDFKKNEALDEWKSGKVECIVATIAFGMGVDQAHVRYVVHYDMPKSFEGMWKPSVADPRVLPGDWSCWPRWAHVPLSAVLL